MPEAVVYEEEQFRRAHHRLDVDGCAVACAISAHMHLKVGGVGVLFAPCVDDAALQDPVAFQWHNKSSLTGPALRQARERRWRHGAHARSPSWQAAMNPG